MAQIALKKLTENFPDSIISTHSKHGDDTALVKKENIVEICKFLRDDPALKFDMLVDLTCVDYMGKTPRFEVVYHMLSVSNSFRVRIKAGVDENETIDTVSELWKSADWAEREVFDMYGVQFRGHKNLKRILLYDEFKGYPLRKDYPVDKRQPIVAMRYPEKRKSDIYN